TVLLDEPVNGLDPEGIHWIRNLLKTLAAEGRTVFVSSHLMSEMALTADHLIVIGRGRLIADTGVEDFVRRASGSVVRVRSPEAPVVLSEWTKLHSLRSTRWSLGVAVLLTIGLPVLFAALTSSHWGSMGAHERADRHPLDIALAGVNLSQLSIAVLGVLVITGEYSTGMIRASFTAVPKWLPVLWAKLGVYAVVSLLFALPSVMIAYCSS